MNRAEARVRFPEGVLEATNAGRVQAANPPDGATAYAVYWSARVNAQRWHVRACGSRRVREFAFIA